MEDYKKNHNGQSWNPEDSSKNTQEEIADELGYKNHSGVQKRITKIGLAYQEFTKVDIYFTAFGMIDIPDEKEILDIIKKIQENPQMYKVG